MIEQLLGTKSNPELLMP